MLAARTVLLTAAAMIAFAGNSLLTRAALQQTSIDAASFTAIRLVAGALALWPIVLVQRSTKGGRGSWPSAMALFAYMAGFSFAYLELSAATGALLLFGAVQVTMISYGLAKGERLGPWQVAGLLLALVGLVAMFLPGISAPSPLGSTLMLGAGIAWGVYSLRGKVAGDATRVTAGNFLLAIPMAGLLSIVMLRGASLDVAGVVYAVASGAIASGIGYAIWYHALPSLRASHAATVQLSVPVITAVAGVALLDESITLRLVLASVAILGGIALVLMRRGSAEQDPAGAAR